MQHKDLCLANTATLLACRAIAQAFSENIYELAHLRKGWKVDYANELKKRIITIYNDHFAIQKSQFHPEKLEAWRELMVSALTDLAIVRASVKVDFREDKEFLKDFFNQMGYTQYFSDAKNGDHVSMYNFIYTFASHLTPDLTEKITAGGLDIHVVNRIAEDAKALVEFKDCFEMINDPSLVDDEGTKMLEEVYQEIQDICRIATAYYYFDPLKRESFNFFKALRNIQH
jgi:hypothetical protein